MIKVGSFPYNFVCCVLHIPLNSSKHETKSGTLSAITRQKIIDSEVRLSQLQNVIELDIA